MKIRKGSATVEAALLMPVMLSVMIVLIETSVFMYNRQAATAIAGSSVIYGLQMEHESSSFVQKKIEAYVRKECKARLVMTDMPEYEVNVTASKIRVEIPVSMEMPFDQMLRWIGWGGRMTFTAKKAGQRVDPVAFLREIRRAGRIRAAGKAKTKQEQ